VHTRALVLRYILPYGVIGPTVGPPYSYARAHACMHACSMLVSRTCHTLCTLPIRVHATCMSTILRVFTRYWSHTPSLRACVATHTRYMPVCVYRRSILVCSYVGYHACVVHTTLRITCNAVANIAYYAPYRLLVLYCVFRSLLAFLLTLRQWKHWQYPII